MCKKSQNLVIAVCERPLWAYHWIQFISKYWRLKSVRIGYFEALYFCWINRRLKTKCKLPIFLCFVDLAWTTEGLDVQRQWLDENRLHGSYGNDVIARIQNLIRKYIPAKDKSFLVIGSTRPWIEVILLAEGAKHITTLEYNPYPCDHPNITTISPSNLSKLINITWKALTLIKQKTSV